MNEEQHLVWEMQGRVIARMIRRPVSMIPEKIPMVALIDYGDQFRMTGRKAGIYRDGEWRGANNRKLKQQPHYWMEMLPPEKSDGT
jgi:hypothetical protein